MVCDTIGIGKEVKALEYPEINMRQGGIQIYLHSSK